MSRKRSKSHTRSKLLDAAFEELTEHSLDGLSIRQLTAAVGLSPTAFYRHFADLDEIAIALVDEALHQLVVAVRTGLRDLNGENPPTVIMLLAENLRASVDDHRGPMTFIARERFSGRAPARRAIQDGLRAISLELASELRARTRLSEWSWDDLAIFSDALLQLGVRYIEQLVAADPDSPRRDEAARVFFRQAFILGYGADAFVCDTPAGTPVPTSENDDYSDFPSFSSDPSD